MKSALVLALALGTYLTLPAGLALADGPNPLGDEGEDAPPPPPDADGGFQGGPFGHLFKKLGLSETQNQQIATIREQNKGQMKALGSQLFQAREALSALMTAHTSQDAAKAQYQKVQSLGQQLADLRFTMMYQVTGVLTAEQRTQLQSLQQEMMKKHHHHHGHGDGDGPKDKPATSTAAPTSTPAAAPSSP